MPVVLSVGQCGFDDSRLARAVASVGAQMERAGSVAEAREKMTQTAYDLILVNRVFDRDGSSGVEFIRELKVGAGVMTPMMLVSDFPEAQAAAVAHGARPGFGKSELGDAEALERLRAALTAQR